MPAPQRIDLVAAARAAHQQNNLAEAARLYQAILARVPHQLDALNGLAAIRASAGHHEEADQLWALAMQASPQIPQFVENRAKLWLSAQQWAKALPLYQRLTELQPQQGAAWLQLAKVAGELGYHKQGMAAARRTTELLPNDAEGWVQLAYRLLDLEQLVEAQECIERLRQLAVPFHILLNLEGMLARLQGDYAVALRHFVAVQAARPDDVNCYNNIAITHQDAGDYTAAMAAFSAGLTQDPNHRTLRYNRINCQLSYGDLQNGWANLQDWIKLRAHRQLPQPWWQGQPLADQQILLWNYQGVGEAILQLSLIEDLLAQGANIHLEVDPRLLPLVRRTYPNVHAFSHPTAQHTPHRAMTDATIDYQAPGFWAARFVRPDWASFPVRGKFLQPDAEKVNALRADYVARAQSAGKRKILGISWRAAGLFRRSRSLALADWAPLLNHPDYWALDLQYGDTTQERSILAQQQPQCSLYHDETIDPLQDLDGQAAQLAACDAVVSVRNSTVHLAGALGLPTQVLMPPPSASTWFWFRDKSHSPWYPSLRLHPLGEQFDWQPVLAALA